MVSLHHRECSKFINRLQNHKNNCCAVIYKYFDEANKEKEPVIKQYKPNKKDSVLESFFRVLNSIFGSLIGSFLDVSVSIFNSIHPFNILYVKLLLIFNLFITIFNLNYYSSCEGKESLIVKFLHICLREDFPKILIYNYKCNYS